MSAYRKHLFDFNSIFSFFIDMIIQFAVQASLFAVIQNFTCFRYYQAVKISIYFFNGYSLVQLLLWWFES